MSSALKSLNNKSRSHRIDRMIDQKLGTTYNTLSLIFYLHGSIYQLMSFIVVDLIELRTELAHGLSMTIEYFQMCVNFFVTLLKSTFMLRLV